MKTWLGLALGACLFSGCVAVDRHGDGDATLTVEWRIDGTDDPGACDDTGTRYASVTVESTHGSVDTFEVPCDEFGTDIGLPAGHYWVDVVLLDGHHDEITSTVETDARDLVHNGSDYVVANFSEDSFL